MCIKYILYKESDTDKWRVQAVPVELGSFQSRCVNNCYLSIEYYWQDNCLQQSRLLSFMDVVVSLSVCVVLLYYNIVVGCLFMSLGGVSEMKS